MRVFAFTLFLVVACVTAASFRPRLASNRVALPAISVALFRPGLERRQVTIPAESVVPSSCTSSCSPVNDRISMGCPVTACCTTTFETQYYNCLECVGMALNTANYSAAQMNLNLLYTTCVDTGYILSPMALPGQTANGTSSSHAASPTSSSTKSNGAASSSLGIPATGATITGALRGARAVMLVGIPVLLGAAVGFW